MPIASSQLVFYASSGMPINDTYRSGGDINSGIRIMFNDLDASTTITTYSSDIRDINTLTVSGWNNSHTVIGESITVSGTGHFTGSSTFSGILGAKLSHATGLGNITVSGTSQNNIGTVYVNESGFQRSFYLAEAGGSPKTFYEKVFIKNNSQSTELSLAYVRSTGTGLMNTKIIYGLENGKALAPSGAGVEESVANRLTAPSNVSSYGSGVSGVWPSRAGSLLPTDYQGIWLKYSLDADEIAYGPYYIDISGFSS